MNAKSLTRRLVPGLLIGALIAGTLVGLPYRVTVKPSDGFLSVEVGKNVAQAATSITSLGTNQDKLGTSPWTALTGLSLTAGDYVFVADSADAGSSDITVSYYVGETASYGGNIYALWSDNTHIYVGGAATHTVRKYR